MPKNGNETGIQWTWVPGYVGATWNPSSGCERVSPGCTHCYAYTLHDQRHIVNRNAARAADVGGTPTETAAQVARLIGIDLPMPPQYDVPFSTVQMLDEKRLTAPLRAKKPHAYFVDSMADLWHVDVTDEFIDKVFAVMALAPQHLFQLLTKRPVRMRDYMAAAKPRIAALLYDAASSRARRTGRSSPPSDRVEASEDSAIRSGRAGDSSAARGGDDGQGHRGQVRDEDASGISDLPTSELEAHLVWPLPNVWLGVSAEDQQRADERIPILLDTPAAVRFVSIEPQLGPIDLSSFQPFARMAQRGSYRTARAVLGADLDWVICGGESGKGARPFDLAWARSLRDECAAAGVAWFMKQLGAVPSAREHGVLIWPERPLRNRHGSDPAEWPEDLRVRQIPNGGGR